MHIYSTVTLGIIIPAPLVFSFPVGREEGAMDVDYVFVYVEFCTTLACPTLSLSLVLLMPKPFFLSWHTLPCAVFVSKNSTPVLLCVFAAMPGYAVCAPATGVHFASVRTSSTQTCCNL